MNSSVGQMTTAIHGHQVQPCLGGRHVTQRLKWLENSVGLCRGRIVGAMIG
jgi:hypothetical protein